MLNDLLRQAGAMYGAGRFADALPLYESALQTAPESEIAMFGMASCQNELGNVRRAAELFGSLAAKYPANAFYRYNQGYSYLLDARYDDAAPILRECLGRIDNPHVKANLGIALEHTSARDLPTARQLMEEAAARLPGDPLVQTNLSYLRLLMGDYEQGWRLHERRQGLPSAAALTAVPMWQGESLAGKVLAVLHEQGFGDSLQFVRYLPMIAQRAAADGGRVIFQPPEPLYRLFATSFADLAPDVTILPPEEIATFHCYCPLMSLPERMHTTLATVPAQVPYLRAAPEAVAQWRERMNGHVAVKAGLVWAGNARKGIAPIFQRTDKRRSTTLQQLTPLFDIPDVVFYSLQKASRRSRCGRWRAATTSSIIPTS
jgi:Flp pilus assembly protein TadD